MEGQNSRRQRQTVHGAPCSLRGGRARGSQEDPRMQRKKVKKRLCNVVYESCDDKSQNEILLLCIPLYIYDTCKSLIDN